MKRLNVTPTKAEQFAKKGIESVEDLVEYLPRKYNDFTKETGILPSTEISCVSIMSKSIRAYDNGHVPCVRLMGSVIPTGELIIVTWFRQNYLYKRYSPFMGKPFFLAGKISLDIKMGTYSAMSPELCEPMTSDVARIYPVYSKIPGMSYEYLTGKISESLSISAATSEIIPPDIVKEYGQLSHREALYYLHCPQTQEQIDKGRERILFDDLLYFALHNEWARKTVSAVSDAKVRTTEKVEQLIASLPYTLTEDQRKTVDLMLTDAKEGRRVNALVQGDVGCGKTIVAILLMTAIAENGFQAALMAPTQVLARQHYEELRRLTEPLGFKTVFLGAGLKAKEKKAALAAIVSGKADFVVGTHSIISDDVVYKDLALTIADEEHKFGVTQRAALVKKAASGVHNITMSATPIPRSLAQVLYGSIVQLYNISTMPAGRKPVITGVSTTREKIYRFIIKEAKKGHQAYVVCPLIEQSDSDAMDGVKSVEEIDAEYRAALEPYGVKIASLTGRDDKAKTEETLTAFKNGDIHVLISTTVIEVGVNVPTATLMVVSNAERFGLASLHQLRGRVGRSDLQAYCVLDSTDTSEKAAARLSAMCYTTDGFKLAEYDLKLRGAGDFLGTRQSGDNKYMVLMLAYPEKYETAKKIAQDILDNARNCSLLRKVRAEKEEEVA